MGLHQIDLLQPAEVKITQAEYMAKQSGQDQLEKINHKIMEDGLTPTSTVFQTQKQYLRNAIDACAALSDSFEEFQSKLLEQYQISVTEHRGRYSYLHPDRQKRISECSLGTRYGKQHLEQAFLQKNPMATICFRRQWTGTKKRLKRYWHFMTRTYQSAVCVHSMMNTAMFILL